LPFGKSPYKLTYVFTPSYDLRPILVQRLHIVGRALAPQTLKEIFNEEAKGILSYRVADRRGDHFDHRGHRNSELD
jgi:hypothetical protein